MAVVSAPRVHGGDGVIKFAIVFAIVCRARCHRIDSATNKLSNDLELLSLSTNTPAHHLIDDGLLMASNNDLTVPSTSNQFNFFSGLSGPAPAATNSGLYL